MASRSILFQTIHAYLRNDYTKLVSSNNVITITVTIDGSTDRRCFAIVTNERALLPKLGQPVRKVIQTPYCVFQAGKQTFKDRHICSMVWCIVNIGNG